MDDGVHLGDSSAVQIQTLRCNDVCAYPWSPSRGRCSLSGFFGLSFVVISILLPAHLVLPLPVIAEGHPMLKSHQLLNDRRQLVILSYPFKGTQGFFDRIIPPFLLVDLIRHQAISAGDCWVDGCGEHRTTEELWDGVLACSPM